MLPKKAPTISQALDHITRLRPRPITKSLSECGLCETACLSHRHQTCLKSSGVSDPWIGTWDVFEVPCVECRGSVCILTSSAPQLNDLNGGIPNVEMNQSGKPELHTHITMQCWRSFNQDRSQKPCCKPRTLIRKLRGRNLLCISKHPHRPIRRDGACPGWNLVARFALLCRRHCKRKAF